ncbi:hypothetical protein VNI00_001996 [Paramarasmius palmivorus]|uniref:Uncharacterized protein n=1 Tax=Paramarasmius palmivorus TaxID=297713 RepID=A0AAW0E6W0_9AGAR
MRGELCVGFASFLSFAALLLLIFSHVGQINTSTVPRGIYMARVNASGYGDALSTAFLNPITNLYTDNASAPLGAEAGLRQYYQMGLYSYCGFVNETAGICSNTTAGFQYKPFDDLKNDMAEQYQFYTDAIFQFPSTFRDSKYLGSLSRAAYYLILLGTICTAIAFFTGIAKHNLTFLFSAIFAAISCIFILIGATIWTVIIKKSESINTVVIGSANNSSPLGITVSTGPGLYLVWAAFACLFASTIPYMIS